MRLSPIFLVLAGWNLAHLEFPKCFCRARTRARHARHPGLLLRSLEHLLQLVDNNNLTYRGDTANRRASRPSRSLTHVMLAVPRRCHIAALSRTPLDRKS